MANEHNKYSRIIASIFEEKFAEGIEEVTFEREDLVRAARKLDILPPKNLGDILYSFRHRTPLPESIRNRAPEGLEWVIRSMGPSEYKFSLTSMARISPNTLLAKTKIPDATPGIIEMYALNDEQALLAKLRYNRLIDIFTRITCYSLQSHLRTTVPDMGQVETDEVYVGVDKRGAQYVFPVQAKGGTDQLSIVQIEQDFALCATKFPRLICCPIAAQFIENNLIALFAFKEDDNEVAIRDERHYRLVPAEQMTDEDFDSYRNEL